MAKVVNRMIAVELFDVDEINIDIGDDCNVVIEQGGDTVFIPRAELEQFCAILTTWNAEHPRREAA